MTGRLPDSHTPKPMETVTALLGAEEARELVNAARRNDARAWARLYALYADRVFRYIYYRLNDRARSEELTGEVFLRLVENIKTFRGGGNDYATIFTGWIFSIARNLVTDEYRRRQTRAEQETETDWSNECVPSLDADFQLDRAALQQAMAQLTEEQQTVLLLRFEEGMSATQIARALGKTETAVKGLQLRGLAALARLLGAPRARRNEGVSP